MACASISPITEGGDPCQDREENGVERRDAQCHRDDASLRIENRGDDGDHAGERDIGRGDAEIVRRQCMTLPIKTRREQIDDRRCEQQPDRRQRADREQHCAQNLPEECVGAALALGLLDAQPQRHEGGVERAFGQQPTKEVGDLQNGEERVGRNARAQRRCDTDVASESEQARR